MKKRSIASGILGVVAIMLMSCSGKQSVQQENGNILSAAQTEEMENQSGDAELQHAMEYGFVPEQFSKDWDGAITEKEMAELSTQAIALSSPGEETEWTQLMQKASSDRIVEKDYGALIVFRAAQRMGCGKFLEHDYYYAADAVNTIWGGEQTGDYPLFADSCYEMLAEPGSEMEEVDVWPTDYLSFAEMFTIGKYSLYSNRPLFDSEKLVRGEPLSHKEAVLAFSRLLDNSKDVYFELQEEILGENTISEAAKSAGETLPSITGEKLPNWCGTSAARDMLLYTDKRELFTKDDAALIKEQGFNYVRLTYSYHDFTKEMDGILYANRRILENMDAMIGWCIEDGIHVCLELQSMPGYSSGGYADVLENEAHYQQCVDIWSMLSRRYKDISPNALSYNLLNEPTLFYFTQESYGMFATDLIEAIRSHDTEKMLVSDGLLTDVWATAPVSVPCTELPADIVQTIHLYPSWESMNWLTLEKGVPEHCDSVAGMVSEDSSLNLEGDFVAGTEIDLYYTGIYGVNSGIGVSWESNGTDDGAWSFDGMEEGKDSCYLIEEERNAYFEDGTKFTIRLTQDADHVKLKVDGGDFGGFWNLTAIQVKYPSENENHYLVPNRNGNTGVAYQKGNFDTVYINLAEDAWGEGDANVRIERDGSYACDNSLEWADMFDRETIHNYLQSWSDWRQETGGKVICNEFGVIVGLPREARVSYMGYLMDEFNAFEIPWAIYTTNEGDYGPIHKCYGEWNITWPEDDSLTIKEDYAVDEPLLEVIQEHFTYE